MSEKTFYKRGIVPPKDLPPVKMVANKITTRDFQSVLTRVIKSVPVFETEIIKELERFADKSAFWAPEQCWTELNVFLDLLLKDVSASWKFQISRIVRGEDSKLSDFFTND